LGLAGIPFPCLSTRFVDDPLRWWLGLATTFKEEKYLRTEGREDREEDGNWQRLSPFSVGFQR
jgi:hypothetical protein